MAATPQARTVPLSQARRSWLTSAGMVQSQPRPSFPTSAPLSPAPARVTSWSSTTPGTLGRNRGHDGRPWGTSRPREGCGQEPHCPCWQQPLPSRAHRRPSPSLTGGRVARCRSLRRSDNSSHKRGDNPQFLAEPPIGQHWQTRQPRFSSMSQQAPVAHTISRFSGHTSEASSAGRPQPTTTRVLVQNGMALRSRMFDRLDFDLA